MQTETLYEVFHTDSNRPAAPLGAPLGVGTLEELVALADDGTLPPREELTFKLVGTFRLAA